ncbi:fatty acyl-CoA hydrolase precursor, medium chain-like [Branchiostoma lanceolatum]|uniref:fatty acyl-CoA hydrolase precursor, medium chain-like n=1 Tax=Branchiostoma lanceolatum TaxID=7740 RepID=UPI00345175E4
MSSLVTIFVAVFFFFPSSLEGVQVQTTSGAVNGLSTTYQGVDVEVFRGIPYAAPPVGPLRFRDPQPHPGWDGVRDATQTPPECPQRGDSCCEDCLYLNVYVPGQPQEGSLAVMIYIHGGGFHSKSSGDPDPTPLAVTGNVIIVTINYRLNVFGFLSTGDQAAPGNYGLLDQHFAMVWVKDNIRAFGGNPDMVTIYGRSAGGQAIGMHVLSPINNGLFRRAISGSEGPTSMGTLTVKPQSTAMALGAALGCDTSDTTAMVECMRSKDVDEVYSASRSRDVSAPPDSLYKYVFFYQ